MAKALIVIYLRRNYLRFWNGGTISMVSFFFVFLSMGIAEILFLDPLYFLPSLMLLMMGYRIIMKLDIRIFSFLKIFSDGMKFQIYPFLMCLLTCLYIFIRNEYFELEYLISFPFIFIFLYFYLFEGINNGA